LNSVTSYTLENVIDYYPYGKVLRHYSANQNQEKYLSTHHQRDEETSTSNFAGGLDNRGARWYDSDAGRFLSLDPLAAEFSAWSSYNNVLANPITFIDPDGKSPWKPEFDEDNNLLLVKEKGDDYRTLQNFLDDGDKNYFGYDNGELFNLFRESSGSGKVNLGNDNVISEAYTMFQSIRAGETDGTVNCFDCSEYLSKGLLPQLSDEKSYLEIDGTFSSETYREEIYANYYDDVKSSSNQIFGTGTTTFGSTSTFFGFEYYRNVGHAATFLGTGQDGTSYYFSKNGAWRNSEFGIFTEQKLTKLYGEPTGLNSGESGYYQFGK